MKVIIDFFIFLLFISNNHFSISQKVFGEADQRTFFRRLYRSSLSFCVRGLEAITTARVPIEGKNEKQESEKDNPCQSLDVCLMKLKAQCANIFLLT